MSDGVFRQLSSRVRNIFSIGEFRKRYSDEKIRVETAFGRTVEKKESFPYGFKAKAKKGKVLILCQGGNFDGVELLPIIDKEGGPALEPGDAAIYSGSSRIICREDGSVEITGKMGEVQVDKTGAIKLSGSSVSLQDGGLPAARQTDPVQSTAADDPAFWQWITTVSSIVAALSGGTLTPPTMINAKIIMGSSTVTVG
jgi:uncharacterized Zn-binding protein involved in type VI secretion